MKPEAPLRRQICAFYGRRIVTNRDFPNHRTKWNCNTSQGITGHRKHTGQANVSLDVSPNLRSSLRGAVTASICTIRSITDSVLSLFRKCLSQWNSDGNLSWRKRNASRSSLQFICLADLRNTEVIHNAGIPGNIIVVSLTRYFEQ